jgi:hypothetical protein
VPVVTAVPIAPVIPSAAFATSAGTTGQVAGDRVGSVRRSLPLPIDAVYALSAVDKSGRIGDRSIIRRLGWAAGTRLEVRERAGLIVVRACSDGVHRVGDSAFLAIPLTVRRWCQLRVGDRVLLSGYATTGTLLIYPLAAVHDALGAMHPATPSEAATAMHGGEGQ